MFQLTKRAVAHVQAGEVLVGAMIGVGMFGIPFAFAQAGFFVGMVYLVFLGLINITILLMYAEVALQTPGRHRVVGYMRRYFNRRWATFAALVFLGGSWGAMVAYILVGGDFLHTLLSPLLGGSVLLYQYAFLVGGLLMVVGGLRAVSRSETWLVALLLLLMVVVIGRGSWDIHVANLLTLDSSHWLLPYGVVLFSLGGLATVPEMIDVMGRYRRGIRSVIIHAGTLVVFLYGLFALAIVGVTGAATSTEALFAFGSFVGTWALMVGVVMGFLAVATSFLMVAVEVQDTLEFDYRYTKLLSWFLMMLAPVAIFVLGQRDFIRVIGFTGAVFGGLASVLVVMLYHRVRNRYCDTEAKCFHVNANVGFFIVLVFVVGAVLEVVRPFLDWLQFV